MRIQEHLAVIRELHFHKLRITVQQRLEIGDLQMPCTEYRTCAAVRCRTERAGQLAVRRRVDLNCPGTRANHMHQDIRPMSLVAAMPHRGQLGSPGRGNVYRLDWNMLLLCASHEHATSLAWLFPLPGTSHSGGSGAL